MDLASGAIVWVFSVLFAPPPDAVARDAARDVLADPTFQRALPEAGGEAGGRSRGKPERWRPRRGTPRKRSQPFGRGGDGGGSGAALGQLLLWVLLFAAIAVLVVWLARAWGSRTRSFQEAPEKSRAPPSAAVVASLPAPAVAVHLPRTTAEDLAREGRFAEAVHALLLDALAALGTAAGASRLSHTSREVLAGAEAVVAPPARAALEDLVLAVECSRFAERPSGEPEWTAARESHARFLAGRPRGPGPEVRAGARA